MCVAPGTAGVTLESTNSHHGTGGKPGRGERAKRQAGDGCRAPRVQLCHDATTLLPSPRERGRLSPAQRAPPCTACPAHHTAPPTTRHLPQARSECAGSREAKVLAAAASLFKHNPTGLPQVWPSLSTPPSSQLPRGHFSLNRHC